MNYLDAHLEIKRIRSAVKERIFILDEYKSTDMTIDAYLKMYSQFEKNNKVKINASELNALLNENFEDGIFVISTKDLSELRQGVTD